MIRSHIKICIISTIKEKILIKLNDEFFNKKKILYNF